MITRRFEAREEPKEFLEWLENPEALAFKEKFQAATEAWMGNTLPDEIQKLIQLAWDEAMHLSVEKMKSEALEAVRHLEERVSGKRRLNLPIKMFLRVGLDLKKSGLISEWFVVSIKKHTNILQNVGMFLRDKRW